VQHIYLYSRYCVICISHLPMMMSSPDNYSAALDCSSTHPFSLSSFPGYISEATWRVFSFSSAFWCCNASLTNPTREGTGLGREHVGLELNCSSGSWWLGLELEMPGMKCTGFSSFLCRACAGRPLSQLVPACTCRTDGCGSCWAKLQPRTSRSGIAKWWASCVAGGMPFPPPAMVGRKPEFNYMPLIWVDLETSSLDLQKLIATS
jgi:hypothetical protein